MGLSSRIIFVLLAFLLCVSIAYAAKEAVLKQYADFLSTRGLSSDRLLDPTRISAFTETLAYLDGTNSILEGSSYRVGLTQFADWSAEELGVFFDAGEYGFSAVASYFQGMENQVHDHGFASNEIIPESSSDVPQQGTPVVGTEFSEGSSGKQKEGQEVDSENSDLHEKFAHTLNWATATNPVSTSVMPPVVNQGLCG